MVKTIYDRVIARLDSRPDFDGGLLRSAMCLTFTEVEEERRSLGMPVVQPDEWDDQLRKLQYALVKTEMIKRGKTVKTQREKKLDQFNI